MALDGNFTYRNKDGELKHIPSSESLAKSIVDTINYYKNLASEYREEAHRTHKEVIDEVRYEMRQKDEALARAPFLFTAVENERYHAFMHKHHEKGCSKYNEGFSISFVGTGVGKVYKVKCNNCGEEEDITEFESW